MYCSVCSLRNGEIGECVRTKETKCSSSSEKTVLFFFSQKEDRLNGMTET